MVYLTYRRRGSYTHTPETSKGSRSFGIHEGGLPHLKKKFIHFFIAKHIHMGQKYICGGGIWEHKLGYVGPLALVHISSHLNSSKNPDNVLGFLCTSYLVQQSA